jgi:hypothetical protein
MAEIFLPRNFTDFLSGVAAEQKYQSLRDKVFEAISKMHRNSV